MSCGCSTYECLDVFVNSCNEFTYIGLVADETGEWLMRIEFNNAWSEFGIEVTDGEQVAVPTSALNENYVHELWVYDTEGARTCYKLKTKYSKNVAGAPVPPGFNEEWNWSGDISVSGNTATSALLGGQVASVVFLDGVPYKIPQSGITIDTATETIDFTNIGGYTGILNFWYRNLVA